LHDGYDVERSRLVRTWLRTVHRAAAPLARWGVPPNAISAAGVATAVAAAASARPRSALLVLGTAFCDGLDGAVAVQRGRSSSHGTLIDHGADRVTDVLFAVALWHAGAGPRLALADAITVVGYESARSLARRRGTTDALVTVGERPIRVGVTALGVWLSPKAAAGVVSALCLVSLLQLRAASRLSR